MKIRKAVIPVAGYGTRFLPATIAMPKEMLPIVDKPVIQFIVEELAASGIEEIIFVTGRAKRAIEDHFDYSPELEGLLRENNKIDLLKQVHLISKLAKFVYIRQNKPKGIGDALLMAREIIGDEPFAFSHGDDIIDAEVPAMAQMVSAFEKYNDTIVGVYTVAKEKVQNYGIMKPKGKPVGKTFEIEGIVEKPASAEAPSNFASIGRFIFTPEIFPVLETTKPGKDGEVWVADAVTNLLAHRSVYACQLEGEYYDCGSKFEYLRANVEIGLKHEFLKERFSNYLHGKRNL